MSATHHSIFFQKRWQQKPCNHEKWQTSSNILGEQRILSLLLVKINHLGSMTKTPNLPKSCHWQVEKRSQHDWSIWAVELQIALMLVIYMVDSGFQAMTGVEIYASVAIWWTFLDRNPWQRIQWNQQNLGAPHHLDDVLWRDVPVQFHDDLGLEIIAFPCRS